MEVVVARYRTGFKVVPCFVGIEDSCIQHPIELECHIVGRNGALARNLNGRLFQALDVGYSVDQGHEDGQSRVKDPVELAHALDQPCCLLRDEAD